jgi:hypothetical protein
MSPIHNISFYSNKFLKILTKSATLVPFKFNSFQEEFTRVIKEEEEAGRPVRIIILKCRQVGGSTWGVSYIFHKIATSFFKKAVVIAHDQDSTNNLFNMCKRFWDYLDPMVRPMKRYSNEKALVFENPDEATRDASPGLRSSISVENANNMTAGRGSTIHHLHCSEVAFWRKAGTVVTGLFQSVPYEKDTSIVIESTANGVSAEGEEFYDMCTKAMRGEGIFRFIFCKWTHNQEYEIEPPPGFTLTDHEKELVKLHPELNERKLAWRRYKIENEMGRTLMSPEDQFRQEYPLTPEEAFISSGRPVFNMEKINADIERVRALPFRRWDLVGGPGASLVESSRGNFRIYKNASSDKRYAIGADVAEGLETGDFSTMTVLDKNFEQVASYHGHVHPDLFGAEMIKMGVLYNEAILAPEVNNHGLTTLTHIMNKHYKHIYMRQVLDERTNDYTAKAGWQTNFKTKILMLDEFVAAYRENLIKINDIELLQEMATLSLNPDGSVDLNGKDRVVSMCIAIQAVKQLPTQNLGTYEAIENKKTFGSVEEWLKIRAIDEEETSF